MSAAAGASLVSRVLASLGGATTATGLVVAGLVVGALGGGAVAGGLFSGQTASSTGELAVYPCPDQGPALFVVPGGQRFLVTGKTQDEAWLRIHNPLPGRPEAWIQAAPVALDGSLAAIPVGECSPELALAMAAVSPLPSLTAIQDNSPSPPPTPAPTPVNPRPTLASLAASTAKISYDTGAYCPKAVKKVTFKVKAGDDTGVAKVQLFWRKPGAETYAPSDMSLASGTAASGTWQVTLDTTADGITRAGKLAYYAVATDVGGATRRVPSKGAQSLTVAVCENTGPAIRSARSSSGSSLAWDPLGVGGCRTATTISAAVSDVDGVKSVSLLFRRPGESSWTTKAMTERSGRWSATISTADRATWIPDPPTGTLRWSIKAVDDTGLATQTKAAAITVKRCDSEATFFVNAVRTQYNSCPVSLRWDFSVSDPDGAGGVVSKATLTYRIVNNATGVKSSGTRTVNVSTQRFSITSTVLAAGTFMGSNTVTWTVTTVDRYGGKSSASGNDMVLIGC